jgi:hypothetical protein
MQLTPHWTLSSPPPPLKEVDCTLSSPPPRNAVRHTLSSSPPTQCAAEDVREVLGLTAELVTAPAFPEDKLQVTKGQVCEGWVAGLG